MIRSIHSWWGYVAIVSSGVVGAAGVVYVIADIIRGRRQSISHSNREVLNKTNDRYRWQRAIWWVFPWGVIFSLLAMLAQALMGIFTLGDDNNDVEALHIFYGVLVLITLAFAYLFRIQLQKRPQLYIGLLMLFLMGLGWRSIQVI